MLHGAFKCIRSYGGLTGCPDTHMTPLRDGGPLSPLALI